MGNQISARTSSPELVAILRASLGEPYAVYEAAILADGIDGSFVLLLESKAQIAEVLQDLGVTRAVHVTKLTAEVLGVIEANAEGGLVAGGGSHPPNPSSTSSALPSAPPLPPQSRTMVFLTHNWAGGRFPYIILSTYPAFQLPIWCAFSCLSCYLRCSGH